MQPDESIQRYRAAARAYPEVVGGSPTSDESPGVGLPPGEGMAAPEHGRFPAHYEIVGQIASTQISTTWRAFDRERSAYVVIKEPLARLLLDREAEDRFRVEVRLASKLMHPNIVPILATHLAEPPWFFTMPFIEGEHLDRYCERHQLSVPAKLYLFVKICAAVAYAHQHGVIHRDLKPGNLLVCEDGEPQLLDFGLGRRLDGSAAQAEEAISQRVMGTPAYMSPEQAGGLPGDTRTDVYALGVILYQLLVGCLPIAPTGSLREVLRRIREEVPAEPAAIKPALGQELNAVLLKALAKDPARRYQSVDDFSRDIDSYLHSRPVTALPGRTGYVLGKYVRRNRLRVAVGIAVFLGVLAAATGWYVLRWQAATAVKKEGERGLHRLAVRSALLNIREGDPVNALTTLWREFFNSERTGYGGKRTCYALWELYLHYPCRAAVATHGQQVQVAYSPDGKWLVSAGDGRITVYDAADPRLQRLIEIGKHGEAAVVLVLPSGSSHHGLGEDRVNATRVCFSPRGVRLYVGCGDGHVRAYAFSEDSGDIGASVFDRAAVGDGVGALAVSPDERWVAAGTTTGRVCLLGLTASDEQTTRELGDGDLGKVSCLAFAPDNATLACASVSDLNRPCGIWLWSLHDAKPLRHYAALGSRTVLWSEDGAALVFDDSDARSNAHGLRRWSVNTGSPDSEWLTGADFRWGVRSVVSSGYPTGRYLAVADGGGSIRFFDREQRTFCRVEGFHQDAVAQHVGLAFAPDGRTVASVGPDGLRIWDFATIRDFDCNLNKPPEIREPWRVEGLDVSPDGMSVATLMAWFDSPRSKLANRALVFRGGGRTEFLVHLDEKEDAMAPAFSPDGGVLAFSAWNGRATVLSLERLFPGTGTFFTAEAGEYCSAPPYWLEADGARVLFLGMRTGQLFAWRASVGSSDFAARPELIASFPTESCRVTSTPDGQWVAACCESGGGKESDEARVRVWRHAPDMSLADRPFSRLYQLYGQFSSDEDATWHVALVKDREGRMLVATSGSDSSVSLWRPENGTRVGRLSGHRDAIRACLALDEHTLVTASDDKTVRIWDVLEQEEVCLLHRSTHGTPAISVRNGRIAVGDGTTVMILDTADIDRFIAANREFEHHRLIGRP